MARRDLRILLGLCLLPLVVAGALATPGLGEGLALLSPALLLVVPLLAGRYVGEDAIERLRCSRAPLRALRAPARLRLPRAPRAVRVLGTVLGARSGERAPPRLGLASALT